MAYKLLRRGALPPGPPQPSGKGAALPRLRPPIPVKVPHSQRDERLSYETACHRPLLPWLAVSRRSNILTT